MYMLFWNLRCDNYSRETTIQGRKLLISKTFLVRQVFKGDNYSREETIRGNMVDSFFNPGAGISVRGITTPPEQLLLAPHHTESKS